MSNAFSDELTDINVRLGCVRPEKHEEIHESSHTKASDSQPEMHYSRSATLAKVIDWMVKIADSGDYDTQMSNLEHWAVTAKPEDHYNRGTLLRIPQTTDRLPSGLS